jgi:hypothetical protein
MKKTDSSNPHNSGVDKPIKPLLSTKNNKTQ